MIGKFFRGQFWVHVTLIFSCSVSELPKSSKQCVCDNTSDKVKCTDDTTGKEYSEGDIFGADDSGDKCEYLRQDYVKFNEVLGLIDGKDRIYQLSGPFGRFEIGPRKIGNLKIRQKANTDNYYCCTADNVDKLYKQWSEWGACEITGNNCGCVNEGEETCGRQIRKRDLKCPEVRFSRSGKP